MYHQGRTPGDIITDRGRRLRDGFHTISRFTQRKTLSAMQQLRIPTLVLIMQELDATPFIRELERAII